MSDYLWDKQGPSDPDVEELEHLLAPMAYRGAPPQPPRRSRLPWVAAALALSAIAALWLIRLRPPSGGEAWAIHVSGGTARFDGRAVTGEARLPVGAWLDSGASSVDVTIGDI